MINVDPHTWLLTIYAPLHREPGFDLLSPAHQYERLVAAVEREHPTRTATMREWSVAARDGLLLHLASCVNQAQAADPVELWTVKKGTRELRLTVAYLAHGTDVKLLEGDDFRRTQVCKDALTAHALAETWRLALKERGWTRVSGSAP